MEDSVYDPFSEHEDTSGMSDITNAGIPIQDELRELLFPSQGDFPSNWSETGGTQVLALPEGHVGEYTGLTAREKRVLFLSWATVQGKSPDDFENMALAFLHWMDEYVTQYKEPFEAKFKEIPAKYPKDPDVYYLLHAQKVLVFINEIIESLHSEDKVKSHVNRIAAIHISSQKGIDSSFFQTMQDNYHYFLDTRCPDTITEANKKETTEAWAHFFGIIIREIKAYEQARAKKSEKSGACCCVIS